MLEVAQGKKYLKMKYLRLSQSTSYLASIAAILEVLINNLINIVDAHIKNAP